MKTSDNKLNQLYKKAAEQDPLINFQDVESLIKNFSATGSKFHFIRYGIAGGILISVVGLIILFSNFDQVSSEPKSNYLIISDSNEKSKSNTDIGNAKKFIHIKEDQDIIIYTSKAKELPLASTPINQEITDTIKPIIANNLVMEDTNGIKRSLAEIRSKYLILLFYDINCSHCTVVLKQLQELYNQSKRDMTEIYAVYIGSDSNKWKNSFLKANKYDWINVSDAYNKSNFREMYQVYMSPKILLFDQNRSVIGTRISVDQIGKIINEKEKENIIDLIKVKNAGKELTTGQIVTMTSKGDHITNTLSKYTIKTVDSIISINIVNSSDTFSSYDLKSLKLEGIKMLELNKEEYEPYGIRIIGKDIVYTEEIKGSINKILNTFNLKMIINDSIYFIFLKLRISSDFYNFSRGNYNLKYGYDKMRPVMISYTARDNRFKLIKASFEFNYEDGNSNNNDQDILNRINTLIPVVVRHSKYGLAAPEDIVFWFEPSDVFFKALPDRIGNDLKDEYEQLTKSKQSKEYNLNSYKSCTFFELCKSNLKNIGKVNIYPNPSNGNFNLNFELFEKSNLKISLYSIDGKELINLTPFQDYNKGLHTKSYTLSNKYSEGIYLLLFQSNDGLIRTERILIN
jgi:peroxiredoxin